MFKTFLLAVLVVFAAANWVEHHPKPVDQKVLAAKQLRAKQIEAWQKAEQQAATPALKCPLRAPVFEITECGFEA